MYHTPFCTQSFSWQILWYVSCLISDKSLFSSCFQHSLCLLCLTMWLYHVSMLFFSVLLLNRILWPSLICISFSLPRVGKFRAIFSVKIFLSFLSPSATSRSPTMCILYAYWYYCQSPISPLGFLQSFAFFPPFSLCLDDFEWLAFPITHDFICLINNVVKALY